MKGEVSNKSARITVPNFPPVGKYFTSCPELTVDDLNGFKEKNLSPKIIIVGNSGVGKTCLLNRIAEDNFSSEYKATIGTNFTPVNCLMNNVPIKLAMWDMAGQEQYTSINKLYFRGANIAYICFDVHDEKSFVDVKNWLAAVNENTSNLSAKFLVGLKCDLEKKVSDVEIQKLCEKEKFEYFETSSKTSRNTTELARRTCFVSGVSIQKMRQQVEPTQTTFEEETPKVQNLQAQTNTKKKGCC